MKPFLSLALTVSVLVLSSGARSSDSQDVSADQSGSLRELAEILVTARKKPESIEEVPTAVDVFTSGELERHNVTTVDALAKLTTGFTFDPDFGRLADRPIIRGQSNILGDSGVSYFIDGIYYTGTILDLDFDDVSSIEIIKGPQSALYGRNTYSGAIAVTTLAPTHEWSGTAKAEYAQFGQERFSLGVSGPLIADVLAVSVGASYYNREGVSGELWRNQYTGRQLGEQRSETLHFAAYWTPTDRLEVRTRIYYTAQEDGQPALFLQGYKENNVYFDDGNQRVPILDPTGSYPVAFGGGSTYLGAGRYYAGAIHPHDISIDSNRSLGVRPEVVDHRLLTALTANYRFNDRLTGTYVVGYNGDHAHSAYDFDLQPTSYAPFLDSGVGLSPLPGSPGTYQYVVTPFAPAANFSDVERDVGRDLSQEIRLRYHEDPWDLLLGGFYYKSSADTYSLQAPVAGWGNMLVESLGVLQGRMNSACKSFFQNRAGFPNCTSVVRTDPFSGAILPYDNTDGAGSGFPLWTTFPDYSLHRATRNIALFGSVGLKPTRRLELTAEVRVAEETQEVLPGHQNDLAYLTDLTPYPDFSSIVTIPYQKAVFHSATPRFTARFDLTPTNHLYAVIATGTKPGGINGVQAAAVGYPNYNEEIAHSYEIGSKNTLLDSSLLLNADVFQNDISGYQLTDSIVYQDGSPSTAVKNIGRVRITGEELEIAYAPPAVRGLTARLNYTHLDARILQGLDANQGLLADVADDGQANCSLGINPGYAAAIAAIRAANNIPSSTVICYNDTGTVYFGKYGSIAGQTLPRVPEHNLNLSLDYSRPLTGDWHFNAGTTASYESRKYVEVDNLAWYGQAVIFNGSIGVSTSRYAIKLWGNNLSNNDSVVAASRFTDATNQSLRGFFGTNRLPRQIGLTATAKF